ncbi:MAG TPA: ABC transporter permease [Actinomycetota bacterium]|nr:ABC transporter permease [Actinomycetota bacterium]
MTRLVHAELLKLWTTRTARVLLALAAAGAAGLVTLVLVFAGRPGQPALGGDALRRLVLAPNGPLTLATLLLGVLGMAGEFRHGTATSTFLVTPVRGRVVAAKLAAAAVAGLAIALAAAAVVLAVALPWLPAKGVDVDLADPGLAARVGGLATAVALYAVLGTGLGALFRNQFAAVVVGVLWWQGGVEDLLVGVLRQPGLGQWLPDGAAAALTAPGDGTLGIWAGGLVLAAYGLGLALLGGRLVVRRDLS